MRHVTQHPPKNQSFISSRQLKIGLIVKFRDTVSFSPPAECPLGQKSRIQPCQEETYSKIKNNLLLGGEGVVSVKDTGCSRQICSLWGGFCSFNVKLQKWPTTSQTGGFLLILEEVMEPCGHEMFLNVTIKIQHKKLCTNHYC